MARKEPSFKDLYEYMHKEKNRGSLTIVHNLFAKEDDKEKIINAFSENAKLLKKRKNGNYLYHEIISIAKNDKLPIREQEKILFDLTNRYLQKRAKNLLAYGVVHYDKDNLHMHLMISANELYSSKRFRLSKKEFNSIQKEIEEYRLERYPNLDNRKLYTQSKEDKKRKEKVNQKEYQMQKSGRVTQKAIVKEILLRVFKESKTREEFLLNLKSNNLEFYQRGNTIGVESLEFGRKFRFKTLGLLDEYVKKEEEFKKIKEREKFRKKDISVSKEVNKILNMSQKEQERKEELRKVREKRDLDRDKEIMIKKWLSDIKGKIKEALEFFIFKSKSLEEFESFLKKMDFSLYRVWNIVWVKREKSGKKYTLDSFWLREVFNNKFSIEWVKKEILKKVNKTVSFSLKEIERKKSLNRENKDIYKRYHKDI